MRVDRPRLIVFSGLPGVGKTTLAKSLALKTDATYVRIDSIEQALARSSFDIDTAGDAGYLAAYSVASDNLLLGQTVVADSVNSIVLTRNAWNDVARSTEATLFNVEVVCSDVDEHRRRIETRRPDIEGHILPTWQKVMRIEYVPWAHDDRFVIDTASITIADCVATIEEACSAYCQSEP